MVVQLTYPLLDARRILDPRKGDLVHAPNWFELWEKDDDDAYLRKVGRVVHRPSTGKLRLPMESLCVDAFRKLRTDGVPLKVGTREVEARPLFFRVFWDAYFACRADLGFKLVGVPPEAQTEALRALAGSEAEAFGERADLLGLGAVVAGALSAATDLAKGSREGILASRPSLYVQLPFPEVHRSSLLDEIGEFMEESVEGLAKELRFAPSYQRRFEIARLAANGHLPLDSAKGRRRFSVWVVPERRLLRRAALDPQAVARHMRITISKLESEREVLQAAADAARARPEIAHAVLQAVEATVARVEGRPFSRPGIATNDASYGAALETKAFRIERYFAANQYHKLEAYRQQALASMRRQVDLLANVTAARDINIWATVQRDETMNEDKPGIQFGDFHAGRDINAPVGDHATISTGASLQSAPISEADWKMLAEELPKLQEAARQSATDPSGFEVAGKVADAAQAAPDKDERRLLDSLKAVGAKALDLAEKAGLAVLAAWLKVRFGG
ncbi:hypothetical protein EON82_06780 [bacterium]|nr:MAG: hypothetical protein EON82_06780 [bacterium]